METCFNLLKPRAYMPKMFEELRRFIGRCETCRLMNNGTSKIESVRIPVEKLFETFHRGESSLLCRPPCPYIP